MSGTTVIPDNAPDEVRQVAEALIQNAKDAGTMDDSCYISREKDMSTFEYKEPAVWLVGDNYERGGSTMVAKVNLADGTIAWLYRAHHSGHDSTMRGGFEEALANCRCFYTG